MSKFEDGSYGSLTGIALIAKVLAGRARMRYTRAAVGNGAIPEGMTPKTMTGPAGYVMDGKIASVTNPIDGECQVTVQIQSDNVEKGFYATCIVLFAEDPDQGEVPYTYLSLENEPEWIRPKSSIVGKLATFDLIAAVGDVDAVSAVIDPDAIATYAAVRELIASATVIMDITIPKTGWKKSDKDEPAGYRVEIPIEGVTDKMKPFLDVYPPYMDEARARAVGTNVRTMNGHIRVFAYEPPEKEIVASLTLLCASTNIVRTSAADQTYVLPAATTTRLGGVKVGDGLLVTPDGRLSVDTASEAELNNLLTGDSHPDNK